jgi:hypothetical protein
MAIYSRKQAFFPVHNFCAKLVFGATLKKNGNFHRVRSFWRALFLSVSLRCKALVFLGVLLYRLGAFPAVPARLCASEPVL